MSLFEEVLGPLCVLGAMGLFHHISLVNARVVSYAERVWPWVGLCFLALTLVCGWGVVTAFKAGDYETIPLMFCAGLTSMLLALMSYVAWQSAQNEDSD